MNKITHLFETQKEGILSVYFTAGYPDLTDTVPVIKSLQKAGVNMIEIGIPFSDPMADGQVIQSASTEALKNGMSLKLLFEQLRNIRKDVHIPLILMGYLNPVMQFGFEYFCRTCAVTGIDGVIIPDLPFADYMADYKPVADRYGLKMIMLITPETSEERIREIDTHTDGFIYMVSSAVTTGAQQSFDERKQSYFRRINEMNLKNPHLTGFGISNKETYDAALNNSSGAIIGSKFIQLLSDEPTIDDAVAGLLRSIRSFS
jgi:tryptophan synthase alpha chain